MAEDAALLGIEIEPPADDFEVLPENWDVVTAFMIVQTQWRYGPSGDRLGLDYGACQVALKASGLKIKFKRVFAGLQVMEYAVLDYCSDSSRR